MNLSGKIKRRSWLGTLFFLVLHTRMVSAAAVGDMVFYGTLNYPPACTINNGQRIDIDFGKKVGVNKVDGKNYLQTINYRITCGPGGVGMVLGLTLSGEASSFDSAALQTDVPDLAIRILQNGQPLEINKRLDIALPNPPVLEAVPVKRAGVELPSGAFKVTGTLLAEYL